MMTPTKQALETLLAQIDAADDDTRHTHHEALDKMITAFEVSGQPVSTKVHELEEELRNEAIEAQFDNLPV